jgi:hypothetical protein
MLCAFERRRQLHIAGLTVRLENRFEAFVHMVDNRLLGAEIRGDLDYALARL